MLSIDEAIAHAREVASRKFDDRVHCISCAEEHEHLAAWLEDYKQIKMLIPIEQALKAEHDKAIGDVMNMLNDIEFGGGTKETLACANSTLNYIKEEVKQLRSDG